MVHVACRVLMVFRKIVINRAANNRQNFELRLQELPERIFFFFLCLKRTRSCILKKHKITGNYRTATWRNDVICAIFGKHLLTLQMCGYHRTVIPTTLVDGADI